jgi:hypothetical protein
LISLLVLSNQKDIFREIENALQQEYVLHFAESTTRLSEILIDGGINIIIIDAAFLTTENHKEISNTLSFFPELTIIAAVDSGKTKNLVNLFENFEVYRYLQKPFSANQIKKCISAATRKYTKNKATKDLSINEEPLVRNTKTAYLIFIPVLILLLISFIFVFQADSDNSIEIKPDPIELESPVATNKDDLHETISEVKNLSLDKESGISKETREINNLIENAKKAENNGHFYKPENKNALHYYLLALNIDDKNKKITNGLRKIDLLIGSEINTNLNKNEFEKAVALVNTIEKLHPAYKNLAKYNFLLAEKGEALLSYTDKLVSEEQFTKALQTLNQAEVLLHEKLTETQALRENIELQIQKRDRTDKLTSLIKNKIKSGNTVHPENNNAMFYINQLKQVDNNPSVIEKLEIELSNALLHQASNSIENNDFAEADQFINKAKLLKKDNEKITQLEQQLAEIEKTKERDRLKEQQHKQVQHLNDLAINAIENGQLVYPEKLNAKYYLQSALTIEPDNKDIISEINILVDLLIKQIETDLKEKTLASASSKIKHTKELGVRLDELLELEEKLKKAIEQR